MTEKRFWGNFLKYSYTATPALSVLAVRGTWIWTGKLLNWLRKEGQENNSERKMFSVLHQPAVFSSHSLFSLGEQSDCTSFLKKKKFQRDTHTLPHDFFLRTLSSYLRHCYLPPPCSSYCVFKELNPTILAGLSVWQLYQAVICKNSMWSNLGVGAGKCFLPCLLPAQSQALSLAGHPQPFWAAGADEMQLQCREVFWLLWAASGKCNEWDSCMDDSCAASFWGMPCFSQ